jgi:hypothetical protein
LGPLSGIWEARQSRTRETWPTTERRSIRSIRSAWHWRTRSVFEGHHSAAHGGTGLSEERNKVGEEDRCLGGEQRDGPPVEQLGMAGDRCGRSSGRYRTVGVRHRGFLA